MTTFEAPGAGQWDLDRSHYDGGMTPISAELMGDAPRHAYAKLFEKFGVPAATVDTAIVNGFFYSRLRPLLGADRNTSRPPPTWAVKLVGRIHPELRRRAQAAEDVIANPPWAAAVDEWRAEIKPGLIAMNLGFQEVDLPTLSDEELADHLTALIEHVRFTFEEHHRMHGYDLGPIGRLVVFGSDHGIETKDMLSTLVGASPSTTEPRVQAAEIRAEVEAAGGSLVDLDGIRSASERAAELLDAYIRRHGSLLFSSYDLDSPTLLERPEILAASIRSAEPLSDSSAKGAAEVQQIKAVLPADDVEEFEELLDEARAAMDMRDDNGPITVEWPAGLLRLALLEAGRRLAATGRLEDAEHIFELTSTEVPPLVRRQVGPAAAELRARAVRRTEERTLDPPLMLGVEEHPPPLDALPEASATLIKVVSAVTDELVTAAEDRRGQLSGTGIGAELYRGVARAAASAEEAIASLADGEILVTRNTSPAYNLVLSIAGGLVTETGGAMCHAAVLSRELGLPAVIGAAGCLDQIQSGDVIELDPISGSVRVVG